MLNLYIHFYQNLTHLIISCYSEEVMYVATYAGFYTLQKISFNSLMVAAC